jgi:hypothetical protein
MARKVAVRSGGVSRTGRLLDSLAFSAERATVTIASATQSPTVMPRASAARSAMSLTGGGTPRTVQRALAVSEELGWPRALEGRPRRPRPRESERNGAETAEPVASVIGLGTARRYGSSRVEPVV